MNYYRIVDIESFKKYLNILFVVFLRTSSDTLRLDQGFPPWVILPTMGHLAMLMAPHSSTLAWKIPGTGEPGGLPSMGSHRVGHD